MKPQSVRLFDVWILGPVLIAFAMQQKRLTRGQRAALGLIGAGTVVYNLRNYLQIAADEKRQS